MTTFYEQIQKKNTYIDEEENKNSRQNIDKWIFRFFLILIGFLPLIVLGHIERVLSPFISTVSVLGSGEKGDLFTHFKYLLLVTITSIILGMFLIKIYFLEGKIRKTIINYILSLFLIAIVMSTILSPTITVALFGYYSRSDGALSWICYITLMFIAMNINYPKNVVSKIMYTLMPFVYINLFIVIMNFIGKDLVQNTIIQSILSSTLPEGASLGENSILVGTLNQWNFMSGMFAMMTVLYLAWAITAKKMYEVVIGAVTAAVSILVMFMSISTSGFLTVAACLPFLLIVAIRVNKKKFAALALGLFIIISAPLFNVIADKNPRVWEESFGFIIKNNPYEVEGVSKIFETKRAFASSNSFELPILPVAALGAGTGRVYIWEKTFDLIKERPLFGYGLDTLLYNFPHYNIDARTALWTENTIVDKPHNLYMGIFYGTGILGIISLLTLLLINIGITVRAIIMKNWDVVILSLFSFAFFVQALFNDSLPSVTSIAFLIMGISYGLYKNSTSNNKLVVKRN